MAYNEVHLSALTTYQFVMAEQSRLHCTGQTETFQASLLTDNSSTLISPKFTLFRNLLFSMEAKGPAFVSGNRVVLT